MTAKPPSREDAGVPRATHEERVHTERLPEPPQVALEIARDTRLADGGFLTLRRTDLVAVRGDQRSPTFAYDAVDRRALDAAVMAVHHCDEAGRVWVWLLSSLRPPLALRSHRPQPPVLWEVPAGLIEPGESPRAGAAREVAEELGFHVSEEAMLPLGPPLFPAPALIGEEHHFFHVAVDPTTRTKPAGDGSHLEAGAEIICVPLDEALAACRRGELPDEKTELALRRLSDELGAPPPKTRG